MMIIRNSKPTEAGYVIVTVAAMLVILVGFTALAIDTGLLYADRAQAQRAADAGALAGALTFIVDPAAANPKTTAENHALAAAVANKVMGVAIDPSQVVPLADPTTRQVKVTITRSEPTFFAKILGSAFMNVTSRVEASAQAGSAPTAATCLKPFFIPNTVFAELGVPTPPSTCLDNSNKPRLCSSPCDTFGSPSQQVCANTNYLLVDPATHNLTPLGLSMKGQSFVVKPQNPNDSLSPSQFFLFDPSDGGKTEYKNNIQYCASSPAICREWYKVLTGNVNGPTESGVQTLIGNPPTDTFLGVGQYQSSTGISNTSKALVMAPIWDPCTPYRDVYNQSAPLVNFCPDGKMSGSKPGIKIIAFAMLFIESVDGNSNGEGVHARLVDILPCGTDTGDLDGSTTFALPIRLVTPVTQ